MLAIVILTKNSLVQPPPGTEVATEVGAGGVFPKVTVPQPTTTELEHLFSSVLVPLDNTCLNKASPNKV